MKVPSLGLRVAAAATAVVALVSACAPEAPPTPPDRPLRVGLHSVPLSLDPHERNEVLTFSVLSNVYEALTTFDDEMNVQPALAAWWENPDDLTWRFHLREGVRFHDGSRFDAGDVVATLERARRSAFASYLVEVAAVRRVGESTVDVVTSRPYAILLNKLAFVLIVPEGAGSDLARAPIGTGPYRLAGATPDAVALAAFAGHWRGTPPTASVTFVGLTDPTARAEALRSGRLSVAQAVGGEAEATLVASPAHRIEATDSLVVEYLHLRPDRAPLDDVRVRRAIDLALDREGLVRSLTAGRGRVANQMVGVDVFGFDPELPTRVRDVDAARRLLAEAGHPDGLDLVLSYRDSRRGEVLAAGLAEAGIRARLDPQPWSELYEVLSEGGIDVYYGGVLAPSADASDFLDSNAHSWDPDRGYGQSNFARYRNAEVDRLVEATGTAFDMIGRRHLLQRTMRLVMADDVYLPLFVPAEVWGVDRRLDWSPRHDGFFRASEARWRE